MSTFKKAKVIMLPIDEKTELQKFGVSLRYKSNHVHNMVGIYQNLYIISDDEIKEGEICVHDFGMGYELYTMDSENCKSGVSNVHFKIIATTDNSLKICKTPVPLGNRFDEWANLPQPSQLFIEKYVSKYNKGNVITDVLVEYEAIGNWRHAEFVHTKDILKVNTKDNTITIKKIKDSWTKEEVAELFRKFHSYFDKKGDYTMYNLSEDSINEWIEKNL